MSNTIDFGIDLGTTNSVITRFVKGEVITYTNPQDFGRSTLPSVVAYKKDKIIVGSKAKELLEKEPQSVVGAFKRKMGTTESFKIKSNNQSKTPVELSSEVLKELKTFINTNELLDAAVITIPSSFDLVQSNATKEAGFKAGFKQVVLLQEPIAASLAYANMKKTKDLKDGQWLVYDLGGGTFDVALVSIKDGEMRVTDHEGNNFLGGKDFDNLIVEKILILKLKKEYSFKNLEEEMKSASGKYNSQYYILLNRAEKAKIALSAQTSTDVVIDGFKDDEDNEIDTEIIITRSEYVELIKPAIESTIQMMKSILTRNSLKPSDLQFILMVGGLTYTPFVRERVGEVLQIPVNCEVDPTTAIAIGAAYYASTRQKEIILSEDKPVNKALSIKASYNKSSKEKEELFSAKITGKTDELFYRITRMDQGFDSGLKPLAERISEDLPLVEESFNFFTFTIYDNQNNVIETELKEIGINSGFAISGQPLPEDICLEKDDPDSPGKTKLDLVFPRNSVLPLKKTVTVTANKYISKGSEDSIWVNVYEGSHLSMPSSNKPIGIIEITGKMIKRDIVKGSDIDITISISESRDLTVSAYLTMTDQEFKDTFKPSYRETKTHLLKNQITDLSSELKEGIEDATMKEDYDKVKTLNILKKQLSTIQGEAEKLASDDVTDKKYQIEDQKRKISQEIYVATKDKKIKAIREQYVKEKESCKELLDESGNDHDKQVFKNIVDQEEGFFFTSDPKRIQEKIDELNGIKMGIHLRTPEFLQGLFIHLMEAQAKMNDQMKAKSLIDAGKFSIVNQNWDRLKEVNFQLLELLPQQSQNEINNKNRIGF